SLGLHLGVPRRAFGLDARRARFTLRRTRLLSREPSVAHELHAKALLGGQLIVRVAAQANVPDRRFAAPRDFQHVIELDVAVCLAAVAFRTDERAAATVAAPHLPFHFGGHVARVQSVRAMSAVGPRGRTKLLLLEL